jgi:hypothetical protein
VVTSLARELSAVHRKGKTPKLDYLFATLEDIDCESRGKGKVVKVYRAIRDQELGAWWILLSALVSSVAAGATGWFLQATVVYNARNPTLALIFSAIYVAAVVGVAYGTGEAEIRFIPEFARISKRSLLFTLLCGSPWLGPVIILCSWGRLATVFGFGTLAFFEGKLLVQFGNSLSPTRENPSETQSPSSFVGFSGTPGHQTQQLSLTIATLVGYLGIIVVISGGEIAIAAALIASASFLIGWIQEQSGTTEKQRYTAAALRLSRHALWATFATLLMLLPRAGNLSFGELAGRLLKQKEDSDAETLHSAVILFTKRKPPIHLHLEHGDRLRAGIVPPVLSIPFSGEYWFFPRPRSPVPGDDWFFQKVYKRPPPSSLTEEGDPTSVNVTLEDTGEMVMQSQQRIGRSLELRSCRWIDVVIEGEDEQPQSVDIELLLVNSSAKGGQLQTLGSKSMIDPVSISTSGSSKVSSFRFSIPPTSELHSFNELLVWFHLRAPRLQKGTTVKIDRFDLIS